MFNQITVDNYFLNAPYFLTGKILKSMLPVTKQTGKRPKNNVIGSYPVVFRDLPITVEMQTVKISFLVK